MIFSEIKAQKTDSLQTNSQKYNTANKYIKKQMYRKALIYFFEIAKNQPNNANINFKIGSIYCELNQTDSAIIYLSKASNNIKTKYNDSYKTKTAPYETWFLLAESYHINYMLEKAIVCYDTLKHYVKKRKLIDINHKIENCKTGLKLQAQPTDMIVMPLSNKINTPYLEHSPVLTADLKTLIFTSTRRGTGTKKDDYGQYSEDIYISYSQNGQWTVPKGISKNINTKGHEASVGLSVDGRILYIYKYVNGGDIYKSELKNNKWTVPVPLNINTIYRETHASISQDGSKLYFASDRPGGEGDMDIYYCNKQEDGQWGEAINLGSSVNTEYTEDGPYINTDDSTLFFSSNGHAGMGGQDLFLTQLQADSTWSNPKNLGFPANSTGDDIYYVSSPGGSYAFYVTNDYGSFNNSDIYFMMLPDDERTKVSVFTGKVEMGSEYKELDSTSVTITIIDPVSLDTIKTYYTDPYNGEYSMILPSNNTFLINYEAGGYLNHIEEVYIEPESELQIAQKIIPLQKVVLGETNENYSISFMPGSDSLSYSTEIYLNETIKSIKKHKELAVRISIPNSDSLKTEKTKSILGYFLKKNVDTTQVKINYTENKYFEILVADTMFLNYHNDKWKILFNENKASISTIGMLKLEQMNYYLIRNPELFIEFKYNQYDTSALNYKRTKVLYQYFTKNGIDSLRLITKNIGYTIPPKNSSHLTIRSNNNKTILLLKVLQMFETKRYNKHLFNVPVFIKDKQLFSNIHALKVKKYFAERGIDTTTVNFIPYNFTDNVKNMQRIRTLKRVQLEVENSLKNENFVFVPFYAKTFVRYEKRADATIYVEKSLFDYENNVRNNTPIETSQRGRTWQVVENEKSNINIQDNLKDTTTTKTSNNPFNNNIFAGITTNDCDFIFSNSKKAFYTLNFGFAENQAIEIEKMEPYIYKCITNNSNTIVEIAGHTDAKGSNEKNKELATQRAQFVKDYLVSKGVNPEQLIIKSYGEDEPIAPNYMRGVDFPAGQKVNRRVELRIKKEVVK